MAIANTPPLYATRHDCGEKMVITKDAVGRPRKRCPVCTGVARSATTLAPEHVGRSQQKDAPPVPPLTLPKNRPAIGIIPSFNAFVEVPTRPAPLPSRYVPTEAEMHPKDLPADHPRRKQYIAKLSAKQKAARAKKREAMLRPTPTLGARRQYQPKPCAFPPCGKMFTPTGPRSQFCEACR